MANLTDNFTYIGYLNTVGHTYNQRLKNNPIYWGNIYWIPDHEEWLVLGPKTASTSVRIHWDGKQGEDIYDGDTDSSQKFCCVMRNPLDRFRSQLNHFIQYIRLEFGYSVPDIKHFDHLAGSLDPHVYSFYCNVPLRKKDIESSVKRVGARNWCFFQEVVNPKLVMEQSIDTYDYITYSDSDNVWDSICDRYGLDKSMYVNLSKENSRTKYIGWPDKFPTEQQPDTIDLLCHKYYQSDIDLWNSLTGDNL